MTTSTTTNRRPRRPSLDPFYDAVEATDRVGMPLRVRPIAADLPRAVNAWQLVYGSTDTGGRAIAASGTVLIPEQPWAGPGPQPVLGYGVGVHGLSRDCAPSFLLARGVEPEVGPITMALDQGWIVAVPDGEGLGMPGPHTYGAGRPGGHTVLDLIRAAIGALPAVPEHPPVAMWGYSEGGRCVAWAAELAADHAPELDLVAVAAGGVPTDLGAVVRAIDGGPFSGLGFAVLIGLAHAYDRPELWAILTDSGRVAAEHAATLDAVNLVVAHPEPMSRHTVREQPWDEPVWREVLHAERAGQSSPRVPVLVYHAERDDIVPPELGRCLVADYRRFGGRVDWLEIAGADHLGGAVDAAPRVLGWLADRLADHARPRVRSDV